MMPNPLLDPDSEFWQWSANLATVLALVGAFATYLVRGLRNMRALSLAVSVPGLRHSLANEIGVVVSAGILLNLAGAGVGQFMEHTLFLDMVGTALAAYALGPWWAAVVGLVTNTTLGIMIFPGSNYALFSPVNAVGGIFLGYVSRIEAVSEALFAPGTKPIAIVLSTALLGVAAGVVCSLFATAIKLGFLQQTSGQALSTAPMVGLPASVQELGRLTSRFAQSAAVEAIRNIPDKTLSTVLGASLLRTLFPTYLRLGLQRVRLSGWLVLAVFFCSYVGYGVYLVQKAALSTLQVPAWLFLLVPLVAAYAALTHERTSTAQERLGYASRNEIYSRVVNQAGSGPGDLFRYGAPLVLLCVFIVYLVLQSLVIGTVSVGLVWRLLAVVFVVTLICYLLDVAARHNRALVDLQQKETAE